MVKNCKVCGAEAVDVWIDPLYPGHIMWVCRQDLLDLDALVILTMGESKEDTE